LISLEKVVQLRKSQFLLLLLHQTMKKMMNWPNISPPRRQRNRRSHGKLNHKLQQAEAKKLRMN